jgi:GT2 family glycosyltransferase
LPEARVTVVVPTLAAGPKLLECLCALERQTLRDFEIVIVDNSGQGRVRQTVPAHCGVVILENRFNLGFGAAINQGFHGSRAPFLAVLNDDAIPHPPWLGALVEAMETRPDAGMCASQVRLAGRGVLDSAGMLIARDGSSKQRGHGCPPEAFTRTEEVLLPTGSAALYRRAMLEHIGLFDEDFFLYCEDTDLGLRARWGGWTCLYVPGAVVEHGYSQTAGTASALKAYYVERNRLAVVLKNFPAGLVAAALPATVARYFWHLFEPRGSAAQFRESGGGSAALAFLAVRAHCSALARLPRLLRKRREVRRRARISSAEFCRLLRHYSIGVREVAAQ